MATLFWLRTISPAAGKISPGVMSLTSRNWIVNTHELGAIRKCCFYLHLRNHFGNSLHNLITAQYFTTFRHQLCNRLAVPCSLKYKISYKCNTFWIVELHTSLEPCSRNYRREGDHQFVFLAGCEIHDISFLVA